MTASRSTALPGLMDMIDSEKMLVPLTRGERVVDTRGSTPAWLSSALFPFRSRFVDVDGATLHYVDEGTGPTLLQLHGAPMWSFMYRRVIMGLRDRYRCI